MGKEHNNGKHESELRKEEYLENGLETQEAKKRLVKYGYNEIPEKKVSFLVRLEKRFWGIIPWMLEATAFVTWLLGKYMETIVIVFLLLFNATMALWREKRARTAIASLKQRLRIQSRVKRDGKWLTITARELVPGDLIRVRAGDLLPADIKLVDGALGVDQSALTGESITVEKSAREVAYSGSSVKRGEATATIDATGIKTYFGKTVSLLELAKPKLHMEEVTVKVARRLAMIVLASLLVVFVCALLTGFPLGTVEDAVLTIASLSYFGLSGNIDKIYTFGFAYLNLQGLLTLMIVRERNHFWKSRPSNFLSITVTAEILLVTAISTLGFLELAPLGYMPVFAILGYTLIVSFLINDSVKVYLMGKSKGQFTVIQHEYGHQ